MLFKLDMMIYALKQLPFHNSLYQAYDWMIQWIKSISVIAQKRIWYNKTNPSDLASPFNSEFREEFQLIWVAVPIVSEKIRTGNTILMRVVYSSNFRKILLMMITDNRHAYLHRGEYTHILCSPTKIRLT